MKGEPLQRKKRNAWNIDESKCLSKSEVKNLKRFCHQLKIKGLRDKKFTAVRNWFMIELGLNTGLRVQEMASLKYLNLFLDEGRSSVSFIGKGNKKRSVWISSTFKQKCVIYLKFKERFGFSIDPDSYILNNIKDEKISKRALQKFFKIILKKAGLPEHYHIHCLRHTYATFLLKASGYNFEFVRVQLGHASITTTQIYAGVVESEGRKAIEKIYR
ncbi:tyrosine-type recombinase/integrase [bacterium]|nr:tyrosine-type recombinase/integrase [bacterium]